jgi:hypothetical protein
MTPHTYLVFGSVLKRPEPKDIDLVVPEFTDDRMYGAEIELEPYERLANATGKPIDLFFTTQTSAFNLAGWYQPGGPWKFRQAFCGEGFFDLVTTMTFEQVVEAVGVPKI